MPLQKKAPSVKKASLSKRKVTRLIGMMNEMTAVEIPPMPAIIRCFELGMDEDILNFLLRVGTAPHSVENLQELYTTMRATGELSDKHSWQSLWDEIMVMSFMVPHEYDRSQYELASIFPGWIELCTSGERTPKRIAIMESFMDFWKMLKTLNVAPVRNVFDKEGITTRDKGEARMGALTAVTPARKSRTIPVGKQLTSEQAVLTKGTAFEILARNKDQICVMNCICRNHKEISTSKPRTDAFPLKSCMPVGNIADQLVESGVAERVDYDTAVSMIEDFERKGCIHTTFHYAGNADHDELCICNCDKESCLLYGGYQDGYISKVQVKAYNKPQILDPTKCIGCNLCGRHCPTDAIRYDELTKKLVFKYEQCVGCGQCVTQCAFDVQHMVPDVRPVYAMTKAKK